MRVLSVQGRQKLARANARTEDQLCWPNLVPEGEEQSRERVPCLRDYVFSSMHMHIASPYVCILRVSSTSSNITK